MNTRENIIPESLLVQLDQHYLNPAHQQLASQKLHSIKQGNKPLSIFLTELDQLLLEAGDTGGMGWADTTKMGILRNAIQPNLLMFLIGRPPSRMYEEFKQCLRDVDTNYSLLIGGNAKA